MKNYFLFFVALCAAFFSFCAPCPAFAAFPEKIERVAVVGVLPFPSVLCLYLGSADKIAGAPLSSVNAAREGLLGEIFPELLKAETSFASSGGVNIEELVALQPDVVFYLSSDKAAARSLEKAGLAAVAVSPSGFGYDASLIYLDWLNTLAEIFPERASVARRAESWCRRIDELVRQRVADIPRNGRKRALFIVRAENGRVVTSGKNFFGQYWCDAAGAVNAAEEITAERSGAVVSMEQIYGWNPDVIFITNFTRQTPRELLFSREWQPVAAVRRGAVYKMPLGMYRSYTPGADAPLALLWIAGALYPDAFSDIDVAKTAVSYYREVFGVEVDEGRAREIFAAPFVAGEKQ